MFLKFRRGESGQVTVDWVVLTAAIVGLGAAAFAAFMKETGSPAEQSTVQQN